MNKHNIEKFDEEFIKKVLKSEEGISLDFKLKVSSKEKIARTISALANTKGGIIVVGISDQKKITGIDPNEEILHWCSAAHLSSTTYRSPLVFGGAVAEKVAEWREKKKTKQ